MYPVNLIGMFMVSIVTQFILYPKKNHDAGCQTQRKSKYVQYSEQFVSGYVPKCSFKIIFYHNSIFSLSLQGFMTLAGLGINKSFCYP
jgi:hypothetical protein